MSSMNTTGRVTLTVSCTGSLLRPRSELLGLALEAPRDLVELHAERVAVGVLEADPAQLVVNGLMGVLEGAGGAVELPLLSGHSWSPCAPRGSSWRFRR